MNTVSATLKISVRNVIARVAKCVVPSAKTVRLNLKYAAIDTETTGLDPKVHYLVEVAIIVADTEDNETPLCDLPCYKSVVWRDPIMWSDYCLELHTGNGLIRDMRQCKEQTPVKVYGEMLGFFYAHFGQDPVNCAGKNFSGFDRPFLEQLGAFRFRHRVLDPGILYTLKGDKQVPDLKTCLERAGLGNVSVEHRALGDAAAVVELLRRRVK